MTVNVTGGLDRFRGEVIYNTAVMALILEVEAIFIIDMGDLSDLITASFVVMVDVSVFSRFLCLKLQASYITHLCCIYIYTFLFI